MKSERLNRIIELVTTSNIETQEELATALNSDGFYVTQATISRDIRELGLIKIKGNDGRLRYAPAVNKEETERGKSKYFDALRDVVLSIDNAENIIVIKTVSGMAMAVAASIDSLNIHEIAGCIAGDDTIMCAVRSTSLVDDVRKALIEYLNIA